MKKHPAVPVPEVTGIDLSYRPRTYFGPLPLETRLLARVTGYQRRAMLRRHLDAGDSDYPPELAQSTLDESVRDALGRLHPMWMGGEYLPKLGMNEAEIARISLASATADQISVRARCLKGRIAYRIIDECPDAEQPYVCRPRTSHQPLTLGELVAMLDGARDCDGAVFWSIVYNVESCGGDALGCEDLVSVSSKFYPQLHDYHEARLAAYFDSFRDPAIQESVAAKDGKPLAPASGKPYAHSDASARAMNANPGLTEVEARALPESSGF